MPSLLAGVGQLSQLAKLIPAPSSSLSQTHMTIQQHERCLRSTEYKDMEAGRRPTCLSSRMLYPSEMRQALNSCGSSLWFRDLSKCTNDLRNSSISSLLIPLESRVSICRPHHQSVHVVRLLHILTHIHSHVQVGFLTVIFQVSLQSPALTGCSNTELLGINRAAFYGRPME